MQSLANSYVDFDGTLVRENSSRVLEALLFARATTRTQRMVAWWSTGSCAKIATLGFMALGLLMGGIDARLRLTLWAFRELVADPKTDVFNETAAQLTLNSSVVSSVPQPITIVSLGLSPVITAFMARYPDITVRLVAASEFQTTTRGVRAKLQSMSDKVKHLHLSEDSVYLTDYQHEVQILQAVYPQLAVTELQLSDAGLIYRVEHSNA